MAAPMRNLSEIRRFINYSAPVAVYAAAIFLVSSVPGEDIPDLFYGQSVLFHVVEYAIFALLIRRAVREYYPQKNSRACLLWALAFSLVYALSDEFHQSFVPNRSAALSDVAVDSLGAFIGGILYLKR